MPDVIEELVQVTKWVQGVHQSRWGYHPCSYETFRKLKQLTALVMKAEATCHRFARWFRKSPRNRVSKPRLRNEKGWRIGYGPSTPIPAPRVTHRNLATVVLKRSRVDVNGIIHERHVTLQRMRLKKLSREILICRGEAAQVCDAPEKVKPMSMTAERIYRLHDELFAQSIREKLSSSNRMS